MASWERLFDLPTVTLFALAVTAITFIFSPKHVSSIVVFPRVPSHVTLKKPGEQNGSTVTTQEAIVTCCKSLFEKYRAPWWLFKYVPNCAVNSAPSFSDCMSYQADTCRPYIVS